MDKKTIKEKTIKVIKKIYNFNKSLYKKTLKEVTFFAKTDIFYIISTPSKAKIKKMFTGILDVDNKTLYIKANKIVLYKKHFVKNAVIQEDNNQLKKYYIVDVDLVNKYDYLFKINNKYQQISCYKISLNDFIS